MDNLKLEISEEKIKVTDLNGSEPAKFLGFEIRTRQTSDNINLLGKTKVVRTYLVRRSKNKIMKIMKIMKIEKPTKIWRQRPATFSLILKWDRNRVLGRMEQRRYITKSGDEKI